MGRLFSLFLLSSSALLFSNLAEADPFPTLPPHDPSGCPTIHGTKAEISEKHFIRTLENGKNEKMEIYLGPSGASPEERKRVVHYLIIKSDDQNISSALFEVGDLRSPIYRSTCSQGHIYDSEANGKFYNEIYFEKDNLILMVIYKTGKSQRFVYLPTPSEDRIPEVGGL